MPPRIVIVDCGTGNLHSVFRQLSRLDCAPTISSNPESLSDCDKAILPGVGHFGTAIERLRSTGFANALSEFALVRRRPILGICLGFQLMARKSEEGGCDGLGWIDADVVRFRPEDTLSYKVPHIGWNQITVEKPSLLMEGVPDASLVYFVHSYHVRPADPSDVLNRSDYGHSFVSAVERGNIAGVQYHPEKSHEVGERILRNFVKA